MIKFDFERYGQLEAERKNSCKRFHDALTAIGVKAYRVNDGWVDRDNNIASFFDSNQQKGYYYADGNLEAGDLIFIGSHDCGGWLCYVENVTKECFRLKCKFFVLSQVDKSLWEQ